MPDHIFGKTITRKFIPLQDGEYINLPSQAPEIYLFSSEPSLEDAINGTGRFDTINYWQESSLPPYARTYTITAVEDPEPESDNSAVGYWEAIRYAIDTVNKQTKLRYFEIERAEALTATPDTTVQDLKDIWPAIINYADDTELEQHLGNAETELKLELKAKNYVWGKVFELDDVRLPLAYKTVQLVCESQLLAGDDKFAIRATMFKEKYETLIKMLKLPYDSDGDGAPDTTANNNNASGFSISGK